MMKNKISLIALLIITLFALIWGAFQLKSVVSQKESIINWDGYGYYMHLPSLFIYGDYLNYEKVHPIARTYKINADYQTRILNDSVQYPVYPVGQALTWSPFFFVAHGIASNTNYPADGFSAPYQFAIFLSCIVFIFIGFYFNRKLLLHFVSDEITALSILLIYFSTNYLYYAHYEISLTHVYLYGYLSFFLYGYHQYIVSTKKKYLYWSAGAFGIGVLSRNSEIFWILIPLFINIDFKTLFKQSTIVVLIKRGLFFTIAALLFYVTFQIPYYKLSTQHWFINGYRDHHFNLLEPNVLNCLFRFYKGWFIYTPLAFLFILGFAFLYQKNKKWFYAAFVYTVLYLYLLISWDDWTYGSTFGFRPIVQSYAILIIPLAYCLEILLKKIKWFSLLLLMGVTVIQAIQIKQYNVGILLREEYSFAYFKKVFLKLKADKHDRIIIDIPTHEFNEQLKVLKTIYEKKQIIINRMDSLKFYPIYATSYKYQRLQTHIDYSYFGDSYSAWDQPRLITEVKKGSENTYWSGLRLPEIMRNKNRDTISYNQYLGAEGDSIFFYLGCEVPDSIVIHNITIEAVEN